MLKTLAFFFEVIATTFVIAIAVILLSGMLIPIATAGLFVKITLLTMFTEGLAYAACGFVVSLLLWMGCAGLAAFFDGKNLEASRSSSTIN